MVMVSSIGFQHRGKRNAAWPYAYRNSTITSPWIWGAYLPSAWEDRKELVSR
jgi:hypothetical protein